jgi:GTP-binding protein
MIPADSKNIIEEYKILKNELLEHNPELLDKNRVLAITKSDMLDNELIEALSKELPADRLRDGSIMPTVFISAVSGFNIPKLKDLLWEALNKF